MAGPQREMNLGVLSVPTWLMLSLLFALAMYGALAVYVKLNPHPHPLARSLDRKLTVSVRWVYGVLSHPVKHLWQFLCTDPRPRNWFYFLVAMFSLWLFVMFCYHLDYMFKKMHVLVVQVEYNQETALKLLGDEYREQFQEDPQNSLLVGGLHIENGWGKVVWPWWTCPFFERFIASFTTQWEYVTDWSAAAWFCGWFGMTLLQCFVMIQIGSRFWPTNVRVVRYPVTSLDPGNVQDPQSWAHPGHGPRECSPSRKPPVPKPPTTGLPEGAGICMNCKHGIKCRYINTSKPGGKCLHLEEIEGARSWPDPKVLWHPAAPASPVADVNP